MSKSGKTWTSDLDLAREDFECVTNPKLKEILERIVKESEEGGPAGHGKGSFSLTWAK